MADARVKEAQSLLTPGITGPTEVMDDLQIAKSQGVLEFLWNVENTMKLIFLLNEGERHLSGYIRDCSPFCSFSSVQ